MFGWGHILGHGDNQGTSRARKSGSPSLLLLIFWPLALCTILVDELVKMLLDVVRMTVVKARALSSAIQPLNGDPPLTLSILHQGLPLCVRLTHPGPGPKRDRKDDLVNSSVG